MDNPLYNSTYTAAYHYVSNRVINISPAILEPGKLLDDNYYNYVNDLKNSIIKEIMQNIDQEYATFIENRSFYSTDEVPTKDLFMFALEVLKDYKFFRVCNYFIVASDWRNVDGSEYTKIDGDEEDDGSECTKIDGDEEDDGSECTEINIL